MIRLAVILLMLTRASAAFAAEAEAPLCNALRQGGVEEQMRTAPGHDLKCHFYGLKLVRESNGHDHNLPEAERIFDTLLRLRPQSPFAFIGYAEIKMRKREPRPVDEFDAPWGRGSPWGRSPFFFWKW